MTTMTKPRRRYVSPPVIARWLEVQEKTVTNWIREGVEVAIDGEVVRLRLPALNVGGLGNGARYRIFRKDLVAFLQQRGLVTDHVSELFA